MAYQTYVERRSTRSSTVQRVTTCVKEIPLPKLQTETPVKPCTIMCKNGIEMEFPFDYSCIDLHMAIIKPNKNARIIRITLSGGVNRGLRTFLRTYLSIPCCKTLSRRCAAFRNPLSRLASERSFGDRVITKNMLIRCHKCLINLPMFI
jgi:hypothetical protein